VKWVASGDRDEHVRISRRAAMLLLLMSNTHNSSSSNTHHYFARWPQAEEIESYCLGHMEC
jgi:hypothetical protein